MREQAIRDGIVQDAVGEAVDVGDGLGGQVLQKPGIVAGEARAVELLQRDVTEFRQQVVAQISLVDREGRLGELAELRTGVGPVVQPRRRVLPEALVRPNDVGATTPIDELGLHRVEGILLAGEAAALDLLSGGCTVRGDIDREGPGEAAMSARAAGLRDASPATGAAPVHRSCTAHGPSRQLTG